MALPVEVTVMMSGKAVPLAEVKDARVATAFRSAGEDLGRRLGAIACPAHGKTATHVRVQFDARGGVDLRYDSCCEALGAAVGKKLG